MLFATVMSDLPKLREIFSAIDRCNERIAKRLRDWLPEAFQTIRATGNTILALEGIVLFGIGATLMQIGEWLLAITAFILLGFLLMAKSLTRDAGLLMRSLAFVGSIILCVGLIAITWLHKPDSEPWSNLQKLFRRKEPQQVQISSKEVPSSPPTDLPAALLYTPKLELSPLVVGEKPILTPYCENAGPSTAYDASQISNVTPIDVDDPSKPGYVSPAKTDYVYARWSHPQGSATSTIPKGPCTHIWLVSDPMTNTLKRELDQGLKVLVWVGLSRWRDEHGQFTYEQCYWRSTTGYWNICENHNGVQPYPETSDDIRTRLHNWVAGTSLSISDVSSEFPNAIFVDHIQLPANGASMLLWQPKQYSQYLVLQASIGLTDKPRIRAFKNLSVKQRTDFLRDIVIEMNRMQLECATQSTPNEMVTIRKTILISTLTNESLHANIQTLNSAIALVEALIQKEFR